MIEELGRGGMGRVYKVFDTEVKEKIAIKLLTTEVAIDEVAIERFRNELRLARRIRHPRVCQVFDLGTHEGTLFITMEYVSGEDLKSMIRMSRQLSVGTVINVARQVCEGLAEAHRQGVVHRDRKPQNIMIDRGGDARIMDFGIARVMRTKGPTDAGLISGMPDHMSPEQARGEPLDSRTDLFSLGVVLYEMATGQRPFEGRTSGIVFNAILSQAPPAPTRVNPGVPDALERVITKALEEDRKLRYQTASDMRADLQRLKRDADSGRSAVAAGDTTGAQRAPRSSRWVLLAGLAAVAVAAIAAGAYLYLGPVGESIGSIAILPFANVSGDPDTEYLSDGIPESLVNRLSQLSRPKVRSWSSTSRFRGRDVDAQQVGRALDVEAVLTGRMVPRGDRLSISAELVDAMSGNQIWGQRYDRRLADLQAVQEDIAREICSALRLRLTGQEERLLTRRATQNTEAYQLYLKGRYHWNKRTGDGFRKGIEAFDLAIRKDPAYALAYSGLADCYMLLYTYNIVPPAKSALAAESAARKALELDDRLAEAHTSLGFVLLHYWWDWAGAEREFKRAVALNPAGATAYQWYGWYFVVMGQFDQALAMESRACELDPQSVIAQTEVGHVLYLARRYDEAVEQLRKALDMEPNFFRALWLSGLAYRAKGMSGEGLAALQKAATLSGNDGRVVAMLGYAYGASGERDEARKILTTLIERSKRTYVGPLWIAAVQAALDEKDQAFASLDQALQERSGSLVTNLGASPLFDSLRADPRMARLMERMGLPH